MKKERCPRGGKKASKGHAAPKTLMQGETLKNAHFCPMLDGSCSSGYLERRV